VGVLVKISDLRLPGFGFFAAHEAGHIREPTIKVFVDWLAQQAHSGD
jgi:hypothetical protein